VTSEHPSLEQLAKMLSGRMEYDELLQEMLPHLLAKCETCSALVEEIRRLQREIGHWDEMVAVEESRVAPERVEQLADLPFEEQLQQAEEDEGLQAWGVCQLLLKRSRKAACADPQRAVDLALLAVRLSEHLGDAYDPEWVLDLRARAHAHLANVETGLLSALWNRWTHLLSLFEQEGSGLDPNGKPLAVPPGGHSLSPLGDAGSGLGSDRR